MSKESTLFLRTATLRVVSRNKQDKVLEVKDFSGLRTHFSIEKTSESTPNSAKISIYNLNETSRSFCEKKGQALILSVGYAPYGMKPITEILFQGDTGKVSSAQNGPDWITTFEVGDGEKALTNKNFNKVFQKSYNLRGMIDEVVSSLGFTKGAMEGITDKIYNSPVVLSGGTKEILDQLSAEAGVEWSVQNGEVQMLPKHGATKDEVVVISKNTGLINVPIKGDDDIEVECLIQPKLIPGRRVQIVSRTFNGIYRIRKATFEGDTHEGDWKAKLECVSPKTVLTSDILIGGKK